MVPLPLQSCPLHVTDTICGRSVPCSGLHDHRVCTSLSFARAEDDRDAPSRGGFGLSIDEDPFDGIDRDAAACDSGSAPSFPSGPASGWGRVITDDRIGL